MSIAYKGEVFKGDSAGSASASFACAWSGAQPGDLLIACVNLQNDVLTRSFGTGTESDGSTPGSTWTLVGNSQSTATSQGCAMLFSKALASSGTLTLNMGSGTAAWGCKISAWAGVDLNRSGLLANAVGTNASEKHSGAGVTSVTEAAQTANVSNMLAVGFFNSEASSSTFTPGSGWTQQGTPDTGDPVCVQYRTDTVGGSSYTNAGTLGTATNARGYTSAMAFFYPDNTAWINYPPYTPT